MFRHQQQWLQTEQWCCCTAGFQYETSLWDKHGTLTANKSDGTRDFSRVVFRRDNKIEQTYFFKFHYTTSAVWVALPTHKYIVCYIFVTIFIRFLFCLFLITQNHVKINGEKVIRCSFVHTLDATTITQILLPLDVGSCNVNITPLKTKKDDTCLTIKSCDCNFKHILHDVTLISKKMSNHVVLRLRWRNFRHNLSRILIDT